MSTLIHFPLKTGKKNCLKKNHFRHHGLDSTKGKRCTKLKLKLNLHKLNLQRDIFTTLGWI